MLERSPNDLNLDDLESLYTEAESCDKRLFSEMRTNLQLVAGEHYVREGSRYWNRIRDNKQLTDEQRLKLTKNHIQRIIKIHINAVQSYAPGVSCEPKDERDLQHQKAAELHYAMIQYWKNDPYCQLEKKIQTWIKNMFELGEVCCKVFWESGYGNVIGYEQEKDEQGQLMHDPETGEPIQSQNPVYGGRLCFETFPAFMLKRDPNSPSMDESPYLIYAKMVAKSKIRSMFPKDQWTEIEKGSSFEYTVFDNNTGSYRNTRNQVLIKEIYFRPNPLIPKGWFYIYTNSTVLAKGELPEGLFPITFEACEEQTGNPRGISPIRHIRPCQIELNRATSKVAEHHITLGDDKVFIPSTAKISQGAMLPGIRVNMISGAASPTILPGRSGEQFFPYLDMQVNEMYKLANVEEVLEENQTAQLDIYTQLYRSLKYKKKFTQYIDRIERFIVNTITLGLKITKASISDEDLIPAIGKSEYINIPEFKNADDLCHIIKVVPRSDDVESQMGKQLVINHVLQYVGNGLQKEDIGKMLRLSPFLNKEQMFEDFTMDFDCVNNDILALDRGQWRPPQQYDDHKYVAKKVTARTRKPDFQFKSPEIKQLYMMKIKAHEMAEAQRLQELKQQEAQFIPSGGYLVACDFYSNDPNDPNKTRRVRLPSESVNWLIQQLATQGSEMEVLSGMSGGNQQDIAKMMQGMPQPGPGMSPGNGNQPNAGQANPLGAIYAGRQPVGNPGSTGQPGINGIPH